MEMGQGIRWRNAVLAPNSTILDPAQPTVARAEQLRPWILDYGRKIVFVSLPHDATRAIAKLRGLIIAPREQA